MKKILVFLLALIAFVNVYAANINKLIFFGDSLSDNGNLYSLLLHIVPKSPPYFNGRFSNGITWAEHVGNYYYKKDNIDYKIYAVAGATVALHMPTRKYISTTLLTFEIDHYLLDSLFKDKSKTLFGVWIGANDYLFEPNADPNTGTNNVVEKIAESIKTLIAYGGKYFLVINLPDISRVPDAKDSGITAQLHALVLLHNQKLAEAVQKIQSENPDVQITFVNIFDIINEILDHPDNYNQKYNTHITNFSDSCWQGGYFLRKTLSTYGLAKEIEQTINLPKDADVNAISNYIMNTPELAYAYQLSKSYEMGNVPCANPDEYVFWDWLHPTAVVHQVLSKIILEKLENQIT